MAHVGFLNVRKNGATLAVPLFSARAEATPSDCPAFCVQRNGAVCYAAVSAINANAAAAFRKNGKTFYLVTEHTRADVGSWVTLFSKTSGAATSYTLPAEYAYRPILLQAAGGRGSSGVAGRNKSRTYRRDLGTAQTPNYVYAYFYIYGGGASAGGSGGIAETFAGAFAAGAVFSIARADGSPGSVGSNGITPSSTGSHGFAGGAGGSPGAGGLGFSISAKNPKGQSVSCVGYGGGGGGGGGGHGGCGENIMYVNSVPVPRYTYPTGTGGRGGNSGSVAGAAGQGGEAGDSAHGRRIGLSPYVNMVSDTVSYNASLNYGRGGAGASSGSSASAYAYIKVGVLK